MLAEESNDSRKNFMAEGFNDSGVTMAMAGVVEARSRGDKEDEEGDPLFFGKKVISNILIFCLPR